MLVAPLGRLPWGRLVRRNDPEELTCGLTLIFPGIESRSFLSINILQGLVDAKVPTALEIVDWTTGLNPLFLYHLRAEQRNRRVASQIARRIEAYQQAYPGQPVTLIGHSGGGAFLLFVLEALNPEHQIDLAILVNAAISPRYSLDVARRRVRVGLWNFWSRWDWLFVGLGTCLVGTCDGRYAPSAGWQDFSIEQQQPRSGQAPVISVPYNLGMLKSMHFGGHFGCSHRLFAARYFAPLIHSLQHRTHGHRVTQPSARPNA